MNSLLKHIPVLLLFLCLVWSSCKDDDAAPEINCLVVTEQNGQQAGTYGQCENPEDQWMNIPFTDQQDQYLNFADSLVNMDSAQVVLSGVQAFPNPVGESRVLNLTLQGDSDHTIKLKIAFVNGNGTRLTGTTLLTAANGSINLLLDEPVFSSGKIYSMYLKAFSGQNDEAFFSAYGNILICDAPSVQDIQEDCF